LQRFRTDVVAARCADHLPDGFAISLRRKNNDAAISKREHDRRDEAIARMSFADESSRSMVS
jgi:hypothetical protein